MTDAIQKVPARKGAPVGKYRVVLVDRRDEFLEREQEMIRGEAGAAGEDWGAGVWADAAVLKGNPQGGLTLNEAHCHGQHSRGVSGDGIPGKCDECCRTEAGFRH